MMSQSPTHTPLRMCCVHVCLKVPELMDAEAMEQPSAHFEPLIDVRKNSK